jgi:hypothetical protein
MEKVALEQDFLRVLWFSIISIMSLMLSTHKSFICNQWYIILATDSIISPLVPEVNA